MRNLKPALQRFRSALAHWRLAHYFFLAAFWLAMSLPLYAWGWGVWSLLSLPMLLGGLSLVAWAATKVAGAGAPPPREREAIDHPVLGRLLFDRGAGEFEAEVAWAGAPAKLHLLLAPDSSPGEDPAPLFAAAQSLLRDSETWHRRVLDCAADQLFATWRDGWAVEEDAGLDRAGFLARLSLESVRVVADGGVTFWFADGDLFAGHWVEVQGDLQAGPRTADLAG